MHAVRELWKYRDLLWGLAWRDVRVRYKQSALGIAWAVILPLSMMLVFTFVFTRAIDARAALNVEMPYPLYAYLGLVPWTFFSIGLANCVNCLVANRNLVTKVYFPREVFPLAGVAAAFVDFAIGMAVLAGLMVYFHATGDWTFSLHASWLFVPVVVAVQIMMTVGIGFVLAMANLFYRDVRPVFSVAVQLWMFISAVVVPVPSDGSLLAQIIAANPLVPVISAYRDCIAHGRWPEPVPFLFAAGFAAFALFGGWALFRRASFRFAEAI
jgi:ABC-type polysaccharide/polyol phosphate export permease